MTLPRDPFGRPSQLPEDLRSTLEQADDDLERAHRVALLAEASADLLAGRLPSPEARGFVGGGLSAWLAQGGDLIGDFFRVRSRRGSKRTPQVLLRDRHRDDDAGT